MRSETEIRELHEYLMDAWKSATADRELDEADKLARMADVLAWVLGGGKSIEAVVETGRKVLDDAALEVTILESTK